MSFLSAKLNHIGQKSIARNNGVDEHHNICNCFVSITKRGLNNFCVMAYYLLKFISPTPLIVNPPTPLNC